LASRNLNLIKESFEEQGFQLSRHQLDQFYMYLRELKEWNTKANLTSLIKDEDIVKKHFIDSLSLICYENIEDYSRIADVGSGAGLPGIPIKIYCPGIRLSLVESVGKKARFLEHIIAILGFENAEVINNRVEIVGQWPAYREQFDLVVARAVAQFSVLVEYCLPLLSIGGKFIAYKGSEAELEIKDAQLALEVLGGKFNRIEHLKDIIKDQLSYRVLVFIDKVKKTPEKYPRRPGIPQKRPIGS